jgi:hypothetical protein
MARGSGRLDRKVEYGVLSSFYSSLLTDNQRVMVRLYCDEDLSLGEIARQMAMSRQAVSETMNRAFMKLDQFEDALGLSRRFQQVTDVLKECGSMLGRVQATKETEKHLHQAQHMIQSILEEEEK